jgi:hypothetical protein
MTPRACMNSTALVIWRSIAAACASVSLPRATTWSKSSPPRISSITIRIFSSVT